MAQYFGFIYMVMLYQLNKRVHSRRAHRTARDTSTAAMARSHEAFYRCSSTIVVCVRRFDSLQMKRVSSYCRKRERRALTHVFSSAQRKTKCTPRRSERVCLLLPTGEFSPLSESVVRRDRVRVPARKQWDGRESGPFVSLFTAEHKHPRPGRVGSAPRTTMASVRLGTGGGGQGLGWALPPLRHVLPLLLPGRRR